MAKEPKVKADCVELVSRAGCHGIKSESQSTRHLKDQPRSEIGPWWWKILLLPWPWAWHELCLCLHFCVSFLTISSPLLQLSYWPSVNIFNSSEPFYCILLICLLPLWPLLLILLWGVLPLLQSLNAAISPRFSPQPLGSMLHTHPQGVLTPIFRYNPCL